MGEGKYQIFDALSLEREAWGLRYEVGTSEPTGERDF